MPSPEELIIDGTVPGAEAPAFVPQEVPQETPIAVLSERETQEIDAEFLFDWKNLPSNQVKAKRVLDPHYAAAFDRCDAPDYPGCPLVAEFDSKHNVYTFEPNEKFHGAPPAEEVIVPSPVPTPPAPVIVEPPAPAAVADPEDEEDGWLKTAKGWKKILDPEDGSSPEVFEGKTKREVNNKIANAQLHATRELRRRNRERKVLDEVTEGLKFVESAPVNPLGPDDIYRLNQELQDPATMPKAFKQLTENTLGMSVEDFRKQREYNRQSAIAKRWTMSNPDFYNDPEGLNIALIVRYFERHNVPVDDDGKNLDTVFNVLRTKGVLLEAPKEEPEPEVPAASATVPASVVPAVAPPPVAAPPAQAPAQAPPAAPVPVGRVRPGSASTGMSPRQASVRPGANGNAPVGLTAEEYRKLPTNEVRQRYTSDLVFRAGVDKLINEGKV